MGFGGISIWQLVIVLVIVVLVFGTKRLGSLVGDLGGALKSFRKAMDSEEDESANNQERLEEGTEIKADAEFAEQKEESQEKPDDIKLYISTYGGSADEMFGIYDLAESLKYNKTLLSLNLANN